MLHNIDRAYILKTLASELFLPLTTLKTLQLQEIATNSGEVAATSRETATSGETTTSSGETSPALRYHWISYTGLLFPGCMKIAYATDAPARFSMAPRINHLQMAFRVIDRSENLKIDLQPFDYSALSDIVPESQTWKESYPDAEDLTRDHTGLTTDVTIDHSRIMKADISAYVDVEHSHDLVI